MVTMEVIAYILSLAFQVAGAVLLIIKYWGKTRERIIEDYFPGSNVAERDENNNITLEKHKVQACAQNIYDNRMAFVFIAIGYILSVFGAIDDICRVCILAYVIVTTIVIIIVEKLMSIMISKIIYTNDIILPYKQVEDKVETTATSDDMLELFK